jgi:hypothetical protein
LAAPDFERFSFNPLEIVYNDALSLVDIESDGALDVIVGIPNMPNDVGNPIPHFAFDFIPGLLPNGGIEGAESLFPKLAAHEVGVELFD